MLWHLIITVDLIWFNLKIQFQIQLKLQKNKFAIIDNQRITKKEDTLIRRNALGALQKLSLRRKPQLYMIQKNLIFEIIEILSNVNYKLKINFIKEKETLTEYSYEYSTALLMNLSLRAAGKTKCEENKEKVLDVLNNLLEHDNLQVRTFVNGTLYSLFSRVSLKQQAKSIGLEDYLKNLMNNSDEKFTKQIQYILEQLNNDETDATDDDTQSELNEEDTDVDDIDDEEVGDEEELEDNQAIDGISIVGEELLAKEYSVLTNQPQQLQQIQEDESYENTKENQSQNIAIKKAEVFVPGYAVDLEEETKIQLEQDEQGKPRMAVPSEMRSRPKILRTPLEGTRPRHFEQQQQQILSQSQVANSLLENSSLDPSKQELRSKQKEAKQSNEYHQAFISRPKVPRTPPADEK